MAGKCFVVQERFESSLQMPLDATQTDDCAYLSQELVMRSTRNGTAVASAPVSKANEIDELQPLNDLKQYAVAYTRERPGVMLLACFGLGFVAGWRLKPW